MRLQFFRQQQVGAGATHFQAQPLANILHIAPDTDGEFDFTLYCTVEQNPGITGPRPDTPGLDFVETDERGARLTRRKAVNQRLRVPQFTEQALTAGYTAGAGSYRRIADQVIIAVDNRAVEIQSVKPSRRRCEPCLADMFIAVPDWRGYGFNVVLGAQLRSDHIESKVRMCYRVSGQLQCTNPVVLRTRKLFVWNGAVLPGEYRYDRAPGDCCHFVGRREGQIDTWRRMLAAGHILITGCVFEYLHFAEFAQQWQKPFHHKVVAVISQSEIMLDATTA